MSKKRIIKDGSDTGQIITEKLRRKIKVVTNSGMIDEKEIERERGSYAWMVEKRMVDLQDPKKKEMAIVLICLQQREPKTPLMAWDTVILSGKLELPPPFWAIEIFEKIQNDRVTGKIKDLDKVFGFKESRGKTSEVHKALLDQRNDMLLWDVWKLTLLDYSVEKACAMVVNKLQKAGIWNRTNYDIDFIKIAPRRSQDDHGYLSVAETLRKIYWKWKRNNCDCLQPETIKKIHSKLLKENYLSQFPVD